MAAGDEVMTPRRVVVPGVDTARLLAVIEQMDDVIREVSIVQIGMQGGLGRPGLPDDVLRTFGSVREIVYRPKEDISRQAADAWSAGRARVDVAVSIEEESAPVIRLVLDALERIDSVSATDRALLIPAASEEVATYRRWFLTALADGLEEAAQQ
jgi:hypothetical protein